MLKSQSVVFLQLFLLSFIKQISAKLLFVSEIFRNGVSEPLSPFLYFKDSPIQQQQNPRAFGNLTQYGEEQQFLLGVALQKKYNDNYNFLPSYFDEDIIEILSDSSERAVSSACGHVLGMFSDKQFTYLPNTTFPRLSLPPFSPFYDDFLKPDPSGTFVKRISEYAYYRRILQRVQQVSPLSKSCYSGQTINEQFKDKHKYIQIILQEQLSHTKEQLLQLIHSIYDSQEELSLEDLLNFVETQQASGQFIPEELHQLSQNITFAQEVVTLIYQTSSENESYLAGILPFLKKTLEKFNLAMTQYTNQKWMSYSAEDTSKIVLLMNALNLTSWECPLAKNKDALSVNFQSTGCECEEMPTFAASIQIELHEHDQYQIFDSAETQDANLRSSEHQEEKYFIRVRYNGKYKHTCGLESVNCGYQEFKEKILNSFPSDLESRCDGRQ